MHSSYPILLATLAAVSAGSKSQQYTCTDYPITVDVEVPHFILNTTIKDDWDVTSLVFNLSRRDAGKSDDPLPIAGMTPPIKSNYTVGATLCGTGKTVLILTHGIIESKLYWKPTFANSSKYDFVEAAVKAGYSVLSYDRIGVGSSPKIDSFHDAQFQVQAAVLAQLVSYARNTLHADKVALVGHSYGAYLSAATSATIPKQIDALILTGFSGSFANFAPFLAGAALRIAKFQDPRRWGDLDSGYLTHRDVYAETYVYYHAPEFEHRVAEWGVDVGSQPFAVGELPSVLATPIAFGNITAPVLMLQGKYDLSACGGNCVGLLEETRGNLTSARTVEVVDDLPAGHNLNLHLVAPKAFGMMLDFLARQGV